MRILGKELLHLQNIDRLANYHHRQNKIGASILALSYVEKLEKEVSILGEKYGFDDKKTIITGKGYIRYRH